jgi:hypothetical protein
VLGADFADLTPSAQKTGRGSTRFASTELSRGQRIFDAEHRPPPYRHLKQRPNRTGREAFKKKIPSRCALASDHHKLTASKSREPFAVEVRPHSPTWAAIARYIDKIIRKQIAKTC